MRLPFDISAEQAMNKSGRTSVCALSPALNRTASGAIMSDKPITPIPPAIQAPVTHSHGTAADEAWTEHKALLLALRNAPTLAKRPEFTVLRMDAYERFNIAFGGDA